MNWKQFSLHLKLCSISKSSSLLLTLPTKHKFCYFVVEGQIGQCCWAPPRVWPTRGCVWSPSSSQIWIWGNLRASQCSKILEYSIFRLKIIDCLEGKFAPASCVERRGLAFVYQPVGASPARDPGAPEQPTGRYPDRPESDPRDGVDNCLLLLLFKKFFSSWAFNIFLLTVGKLQQPTTGEEHFLLC